jgi:hypothetical protein
MAVIPSPGRDNTPARSRAPIGAPRARQNYTQAQIEQAVEGMMMRLSAGHGFNAAAARQIAQLIGPYVNDANTGIPPGGVLIGNQAFERMVLEKAPALLSDTNDPATRAALARLAQQQNASASPLLTPAQMAALGLTGGFAGGGQGRSDGGSTGTRSSSSDQTSSTTYDATLVSSESGVFNSLAKMYGAEAAHSAIDFSRDLGTTPDMARKFIKLDEPNREAFRDFVESIRNDSTLSPEQKEQKVEEFRKTHPGSKVLTKGDMLKIIKDGDKKQIELKGRQAGVHGESQEDRLKDNRQAGVEKSVETAHKQTVAQLEKNPAAEANVTDQFARRSAQRHEETGKDQPKQDASVRKQGSRNAPTPSNG